jgi:putative Mn2+ efflux pump MntP
LEIHSDLVALAKVIAVAFAVGLDVFAISIGIGLTGLSNKTIFRIGLAFAGSEIGMQLIGYEIGAGAGKLIGEIAVYVGFAILAFVGILMIRSSMRHHEETGFDATRGTGLLMTSISVSLDSLGVGIALPAAGISLVPLLITLSITTTAFTLLGLEFGSRLGERYEHRAELAAGIVLIILSGLFIAERAF